MWIRKIYFRFTIEPNFFMKKIEIFRTILALCMNRIWNCNTSPRVLTYTQVNARANECADVRTYLREFSAEFSDWWLLAMDFSDFPTRLYAVRGSVICSRLDQIIFWRVFLFSGIFFGVSVFRGAKEKRACSPTLGVQWCSCYVKRLLIRFEIKYHFHD